MNTTDQQIAKLESQVESLQLIVRELYKRIEALQDQATQSANLHAKTTRSE